MRRSRKVERKILNKGRMPCIAVIVLRSDREGKIIESYSQMT